MKWTVYQVNWIRSSFRALSLKFLFHRDLVSGTEKIFNPSTLLVHLSGRKIVDLRRHNNGKNTELWCPVVVLMKCIQGCATVTERLIDWNNSERKIPLEKLYGNRLKQSTSIQPLLPCNRLCRRWVKNLSQNWSELPSEHRFLLLLLKMKSNSFWYEENYPECSLTWFEHESMNSSVYTTPSIYSAMACQSTNFSRQRRPHLLLITG